MERGERWKFVFAVLGGAIIWLLLQSFNKTIVQQSGGNVSVAAPALGELPSIMIRERSRPDFPALAFIGDNGNVGEAWPVATPEYGSDGHGCWAKCLCSNRDSHRMSEAEVGSRMLYAQPLLIPPQLVGR